ncbi:hypothetical protein UFOVP821_40 [uncultured Caudovirales phage]|uniref:Uncharacterized protein n=1 Tax=uncultured Caudovirales phage TaxID=2100421 RepID=A0A6J5P8C7_9CAUD|nr:hypothetical protein UFOVP821_40 [uncultured Caudovirales phage]
MSTDIDICNLALSHVGDSALVTSITGADNSIQATQCARFYPIARDQVLERHPWRFSLKHSTLVAASVTLPDSWAYAYAMPDNCLMICNILNEDTTYGTNYPLNPTGPQRVPFSVEMVGTTQVLFCNQSSVTLQYCEKVTDATKYPASMVMAISLLLATFLAGPLIKGKTALQMSQTLKQAFEVEFLKAAALDAAFTRTESNRTNVGSSILARV